MGTDCMLCKHRRLEWNGREYEPICEHDDCEDNDQFEYIASTGDEPDCEERTTEWPRK